MPVATRWFRGYEAWLVGAPLGYFASALAASALYRFQIATPLTVALAALALAVIGWLVRGPSEKSPAPPAWLLASAGCALAIVVAPFLNVGASVDEGAAYRAYFSADWMTHLSVVAELQKDEFPLTNPFYNDGALGYYWLFFTFPAAFGGAGVNQSALLVTFLFSGLSFACLLFMTATALGLTPRRAFVGSAVVLSAVSFEGVLALLRTEAWQNVNVDAMSRWVFELVSLDGLHRSLLYTPQHLFSYGLLLVLIVLVIRGEPSRLSSAAFCGVLLGGMAGSSIVTAMLAGPWLVLVLWRRRADVPFLATAATATVTSSLFLGWYVALGFFGGAPGALTLRVPKLLELPSILLLDVGVLTIFAAVRFRSRDSFDRHLYALSGMALTAVLFLDLTGYEGVWMAWRAGSVLIVALGLIAMRALRWPGLVLAAPALLTLVLDVTNASDITNRNMSPGGFPWTTVVRADERDALEWIRRETAPDAVVQWDVRARELGEWALIPALGERRMAVGFPIFLLDLQKYRVRERRWVRPIFNSGDAPEAHRRARELGIDYVIIGAQELRVRGERVRPLFEAPNRFRVVFERGEVAVLEVLAP